MRKRFISLLATFFLATTALRAYDFKFGDLYYNITDDNTVEVTNRGTYGAYEFTSANIPASVIYNGTTYNVTSIGGEAFSCCYDLTAITIPNSVTSIGSGAFNYCKSLTSISIPNSVTSIGGNAFYNTPYYENLQDGVIYINNVLYAYKGEMPENTSVTVKEGTVSISESAFEYCTGLISIVIPNSVTSIGGNAFNDTPWFKRLPNGVVYINKMLYTYKGDMPKNTSIAVQEGTISISQDAFLNDTNLISITIPSSVTHIGEDAFMGAGLTSIVVEKGNTIYDSRNNCNAIIKTKDNTLIFGCQTTVIPNDITSIGKCAFMDCSGLTSITIPNSVTRIREGAFSGCTGLTTLSLGNGLTHIGEYAFGFCTGLTSVTIPNSVKRIGDGAFTYCEKLASVTIPNSVVYLSGFEGCTGLTSITIPSSVTSIEDGAFAYCENLTAVTIPNSVVYLSGFEGCTGLTSITIPSSVTTIGREAFRGCEGLTSIAIPNSVTIIGDRAFQECTNITSIAIPTNVTNIGELALAECSRLTSITCYPQEPPVADEQTFGWGDECFSDITLYVPCNSISTYKSASVWGKFKNTQCIASEPTTVDGMTATPAATTVTFDWQANKSAASYILVVSTDKEVFCSLVFNAKGQLNSIAYAPGRGGQRHQPAAIQTADGFRFTVIGLSEATHYTYTMTVKDINDIVRNTYTGDFTTLGTPAAVDNMNDATLSAPQKILRNGQVLIQRGPKTYTLTGIEVE